MLELAVINFFGLEESTLGGMATFIFYTFSLIVAISSSMSNYFIRNYFDKIYIDSKKIFFEIIAINIIDLVSIFAMGVLFYLIKDISKSEVVDSETKFIFVVLVIFFIIFVNEIYLHVLVMFNKNDIKLNNKVSKNGIIEWGNIFCYIIIVVSILILINYVCKKETYLIGSLILLVSIMLLPVVINKLKIYLKNIKTIINIFRLFQILNIIMVIYAIENKIMEDLSLLYTIIIVVLLCHLFLSISTIKKIYEGNLNKGPYNVYINYYENSQNTIKYLVQDIVDNNNFFNLYQCSEGKSGDKKDIVIINKNLVHKIEIENQLYDEKILSSKKKLKIILEGWNMGIKRDNKIDYIKIAKFFCLLTPVIVSLIVLILVGTIVFGRFFSPYPIEMRINNIEIMGSSILSIIGIAVTVWVGLNIYNVIERKEVETLREDLYSLNNSLDDWKNNYQKELFTKWEEHLKNDDFLRNEFDDFFNDSEEIRELIKRDYMLLSLVGQILNEDKIKIDEDYLKDIISNSALETDEFEINKIFKDDNFGKLSIYSSFSDNVFNYERKMFNGNFEAKEEIEESIKSLKIENDNMNIMAKKIINHKE